MSKPTVHMLVLDCVRNKFEWRMNTSLRNTKISGDSWWKKQIRNTITAWNARMKTIKSRMTSIKRCFNTLTMTSLGKSMMKSMKITIPNRSLILTVLKSWMHKLLLNRKSMTLANRSEMNIKLRWNKKGSIQMKLTLMKSYASFALKTIWFRWSIKINAQVHWKMLY